MSNKNLHTPPPGVQPNLQDPEDRAYRIYIVAGISLVLIQVFAGGRCYAKKRILQWKKDDYAFVVGLCAGNTYIAMVLALYCKGSFGKHIWDLPPHYPGSDESRIFAAIEIMYQLVVWLIKLPLFLILLEVFGRFRWMRLFVWGGLIFSGAFSVAAVTLEVVVCNPTTNGKSGAKVWSMLSSFRCARNVSPSFAMSSVNLVVDVFLLVLPLSAVWSLHLPMRKKISVSAMFLIGFLACICNAIEIYSKKFVEGSTDFTWKMDCLMISSICEMSLGILIPCVPAVAAMLKRYRPLVEAKITNIRRIFTKSKDSQYSVSTRAISGSNSWERRISGPYVAISEPMSAVIRGGRHSDDLEAQTFGSRNILFTTEVIVRPSSYVGRDAPQQRGVDGEESI